MKLEQQLEIFDKTVEQLKEILMKKGNDYANADKLSNFKLAGNITGIGAELNCLSLIATKVARLGVLLNATTPQCESTDDSILDLINYAILLRMIIIENEEDHRLRISRTIQPVSTI
jgi:hypothetical protein